MSRTGATFHKGLTSHLRARLRLVGASVDEATAQKLLTGKTSLGQPWNDELATLRWEIKDQRMDLMRTWEGEHPGRKPFPEPFAQRQLTALSKILKGLEPEDGHVPEWPEVQAAIRQLRDLRSACQDELLDDLEPTTEGD